MSNLLNEKEVAEKYNIAPGTLRRWRWAGRGLPFKVLGRPDNTKRGGVIRYSESEIEDYLAKNGKL
jgi:predicted site-specific integrase-resolvase